MPSHPAANPGTTRREGPARRRWRRSLALFAAAVVSLAATSARAQVGQSGMAQPGGLVNRALNRIGPLGADGPGLFYYGINAADRGLGYRGGYMTLGGFIPAAEDGLGGFWSADLRTHLSEYGGFFSNLGAVRKQFIGGTILGVGVYWDYDGDMNQYPVTLIPTGNNRVYSFAGGQTYNQVGISGEWLTNWGNLRSNGYIPVGSTAQLVGPFIQNTILCQNGVNAALGGADFEVGAYVPGLADWAGMVSVGGYALGNTRYTSVDGQVAVPWFGGVYTRLDTTFLENWDFSLQANNDSYFDWTGFARLTYRMGTSRRRNVADQMEQPMMRNEHIVRARQVPVVALNPGNLDADGMPQPWRIFHVNNTASAGGDGTVESPFDTIQAAGTAADAQYDIVYVAVGQSQISPYVTAPAGFSFSQPNQYLIGEGGGFRIPTVNCGLKSLLATSTPGLYPVLTNPLGAAIVVNQSGSVVDHFEIRDSLLGISDGPGITAPGVATITDVRIFGNGGAAQRGIEIANSTGRFDFSNMLLQDLRNNGVVVSAANANVDLRDSRLQDTGPTAVLVSGSGATMRVVRTTIADTAAVPAIGGDIAITTGVDVRGPQARVEMRDSNIQRVSGTAVVTSGIGARFDAANVGIQNTQGSALVASGASSVITATNTRIVDTGSTAIQVSGTSAGVYLTDSRISNVAGSGASVTGSNSAFSARGTRIEAVSGNGIEAGVGTADAVAQSIFVSVADGSSIRGVEGDGIQTNRAAVRLADSQITDFGGVGIRATEVRNASTNSQLVAAGTAENAVWVQGATIRNPQRPQGSITGGIVVENSNLRVERSDASDPRSQATTIASTGQAGIRATLLAGNSGTMDVLVDSAAITGVNTGIIVAANAGTNAAGTSPTNIINFTATNNQITSNVPGTGISVSAVFNTALDGPAPAFPFRPGTAQSRVNANIRENRIQGGGGRTPILLTTVGGPTQDDLGAAGFVFAAPFQKPIWVQAGGQIPLQSLNNGAAVTEVPAPGGNIQTSVNYDPAINVGLPPAAPPRTIPAPPVLP